MEGIFAKLEEETEELREAIRASSATAGVASEEVVSEVGDLLFTLVNLGRRLHVEPELALRHTNGKFRRRFAAMEAELGARGTSVADVDQAELERSWEAAKAGERRA